MSLIYAGIGSRQVTEEAKMWQFRLATSMGDQGWILRSGHADGSDLNFEYGAINARSIDDALMEIYLPWAGFNGAPRDRHQYINADVLDHQIKEEAYRIAAQFHPAWKALKASVKNLHARNVHQIVGADLQTPVKLVICWTPGAKGGGGTGQALRIAKYLSIPIFDLADPKQHEPCVEFINAQWKAEKKL